MPVHEIGTEDVLAVLRPIWTTKSETASRVRGRIEAVIDAARARGLIAEDIANPARWRGHLSHWLPRRQKLTRGHHAAMPYKELPAFVQELRRSEATAALALEFLILTAARTGEVLGARWDELDLDVGVWSLPAERMKSGRAHRVPLSARTLEIIEVLKPLRDGQYLFPGAKRGRPLSTMAMMMVLRRSEQGHVTVHGFRSSFRDWVGDATSFPTDLAESALAHIAGDQTERAYRRVDALERRRTLMDEWEAFCCSSSETAVQP